MPTLWIAITIEYILLIIKFLKFGEYRPGPVSLPLARALILNVRQRFTYVTGASDLTMATTTYEMSVGKQQKRAAKNV
jgi:hypothetical protein